MTQEEAKKLATNIFRLLKVQTIAFPIGRTDKGELALKYTKDREEVEILLDSVPLSMKEYDNRELQSIINKLFFAKENPIFTPPPHNMKGQDATSVVLDQLTAEILKQPKKRGRPVGSKNKK